MILRKFIYSVWVCSAFFLYQCAERKAGSVVTEKIDFKSFTTIELTSAEEGNFILPKFSLDESSIVFLSSDYSALFRKQLSGDRIEKLFVSSYKIVDFISSVSADTVYAIERSFNPKSKFKSRLIGISDSTYMVILESPKTIHNLSETSKMNLIFMLDDSIKFYDIRKQKITESLTDNYSLMDIDSTEIHFIGKDRTDKIKLTNHQQIGWVEKISSDSILIYSAQDKLILLSLKLKDIVRLGDFENPQFNKSQKLIGAIKTSNDGMKITGADIYLIPIGNKEFRLTNSPNDIESNLNWSPSGALLAFDVNGQIKYLKFNHKKPSTR